jgi:hypothetical protein
MTTKLQGTIESIRQVIVQIGPATARQIETHPDVVAACRSSKAKARRLIERLNAQGYIASDQAQQQPKYWVEQDRQAKPIVMETKPLLTNAWHRKNGHAARNAFALDEN